MKCDIDVHMKSANWTFVLKVYLERSQHLIGIRSLMLEGIMPFSSLSYILKMAGLENSLFWKVNQVLVVHAYHIRSMAEVGVWITVYQYRREIWQQRCLFHHVFFYSLLTSSTLLFTPYWGYHHTVILCRSITVHNSITNHQSKKVE